MFALRKVSCLTLSFVPERYTDFGRLTPSAAITATLQRFKNFAHYNILFSFFQYILAIFFNLLTIFRFYTIIIAYLYEGKYMKQLLKDGFSELGIDIKDETLEKLIKYADLLKIWNEKMNLTAVIDDFGIATKHFLDSATPILTGLVNGRVIDVGTGAGFPGMVLKILKPELDITLLDSLKKRLVFLEEVAKELDIDVNLVHMRAEDAGRQMRGKFDTAVSRAVANMSVLSEFCLPLIKEGGSFLALKGPLAQNELDNAKRAIHILGGDILPTFSVPIPETDLNHKIILIKKVRQTPISYPRKAGIVTKNPLGTCYNPKKKPTK